ncbi:MAG TPA: GntR family transcriptional regulator [Polyangia bacterium]|jgi:GntR family transcriptional repressor for pyruvate dehydrogenase complex
MVKPIQFPPSARRARGESVVEKLRREILLGRYQPGARLPPERELALKLGTNRNTLREAMRTLESEKLVRSRQGDGTLVLDWRAEGEINLLPHFLAEETPIDERFEALYTLFRLRDSLIDQALSFAAGHTEDADVAALRGALAQLGAVESGTPAAVDADIEFYRRLVVSARATVLTWIFNTFARIFGLLGERYPELWKVDRAYVDALDEVVRAVIKGDEERARSLMHDLLTRRSGVVLSQLAPQPVQQLGRLSLSRGVPTVTRDSERDRTRRTAPSATKRRKR